MSISRFDDGNGSFFVLVHDDELDSLETTFAAVPAGLLAIRGEERAVYPDHLERRWTGIRPKRPRERVLAGRSSGQ